MPAALRVNYLKRPIRNVRIIIPHQMRLLNSANNEVLALFRFYNFWTMLMAEFWNTVFIYCVEVA